MIIDSHSHLDQPAFAEDRTMVLERARAAGVGAIVNPGTDLASSALAIALAGQSDLVYAAVGVHPDECAGYGDATREGLARLAATSPKVVAIGEIGLDYYWNIAPHEQQRAALRSQLGLAAELDLPVILHSRSSEEGGDALADLMWELAQWVPAVRKRRGPDAILGVLHAFSGDLPAAEAAYELGFVLGLGGPVTFKNARALHALVPQLRIDRLVLETDAPYLAPHPYRGQRNEPAYLPLVVQALAELTGMAPEKIIEQTAATARRTFSRLRDA